MTETGGKGLGVQGSPVLLNFYIVDAIIRGYVRGDIKCNVLAGHRWCSIVPEVDKMYSIFCTPVMQHKLK